MTADQIKNLIAAGLSCQYLELTGDGRHWFVTIVSDEFANLRAIARHQKVYATLADKMQSNEVHALSIKAFTPDEWTAQEPN